MLLGQWGASAPFLLTLCGPPEGDIQAGWGSFHPRTGVNIVSKPSVWNAQTARMYIQRVYYALMNADPLSRCSSPSFS